MTASRPALLEVRDLSVEFRSGGSIVRAVSDLSYTVNEGQTLVLIGESGSGKTVSALTVMGLLDSPTAFVSGGQVLYRGVDLLTLTPQARRAYRGRRIAMIFQDALSALNPALTVGSQIAEMYQVHAGDDRRRARDRAIGLMKRVRIPDAVRRFDDYPHQFSGGMRQRIMIALAVAVNPEVLIADEPTTALDVTVQAQILDLLADLQEEHGMALLLITHDLGVAADVADSVAIMYAGRLVEFASVADLYAGPAHPYTVGLMDSVPRFDSDTETLRPIRGNPPNLARIPTGCAFHPRCPIAQSICEDVRPELLPIGDRLSACHFAADVLHAAHG
jgi:oligopeptide transport system ATP-binding protein